MFWLSRSHIKLFMAYGIIHTKGECIYIRQSTNACIITLLCPHIGVINKKRASHGLRKGQKKSKSKEYGSTLCICPNNTISRQCFHVLYFILSQRLINSISTIQDEVLARMIFGETVQKLFGELNIGDMHLVCTHIIEHYYYWWIKYWRFYPKTANCQSYSSPIISSYTVCYFLSETIHQSILLWLLCPFTKWKWICADFKGLPNGIDFIPIA